MPKLVCVSRYRTAKLTVEPGQILDVSEAEAAQLRADAPGCWEDADAKIAASAKEIDEQAAQMVKDAQAKAQAEAERAAAEQAEQQRLEEEERRKALDEPPADKMIRGAPKSK